MRSEFEFGCAMLFFDNPLLKVLQSEIKEEDLHEFGLELESHISLLYGLHSKEIDPRLVISKCSGIKYVEIDVLGISAFLNSEFDVIKFDVDSPDLKFLNYVLSKLPNSNPFDHYLPHSTIAYLKPGTSQKYLQTMNKILADNPLKFKPSRIVYSTPEGTYNRNISN